MAFGQSTGPSASGRQVKDLLELLQNAGHDDFRDARGPMGFNQRQAGGKFTADEAAEYIDQLQTAEYEAEHAPAKTKKKAPAKTKAPPKTAPKTPSNTDTANSGAEMSDAEIALRTMSTKALVLEIRRRGGWIVTKDR
ncbi:MAG: hypothetical protein ACI9C1_003830 [Candidatus Aldehydirespiratoraceae bacterium]|jgi:hypothetical protein